MVTERTYQYLVPEPQKQLRQLFIRDTGVRASTIWQEHFVNGLTPEEIAEDRDIPINAVVEALEYCEKNWDIILQDRDEERALFSTQGQASIETFVQG